MNLSQAQLGQSSSINLGGYIPAGPQKRKLWQDALVQMLGQAGGEMLSGVTSHVTTPDTQKYLEQQGVAIDKQPWYKREITPTEASGFASQNQNRLGTEAQTAASKAQTDIAERKLGVDTVKTAADIARDKDSAAAQAGSLNNDTSRVEIAKKGLELAKTKQEQDFYLSQIQAYSGLKSTASEIGARGTDSSLKRKADARAEAAAPGERALTEAQTKNQAGQARYHEAAAGGGPTSGGGGMLAEDRALALKGLGLEALSPEKQQAAQQAALMVPMTTDRVAYRNAVRQAAAAAVAN